jgi:glyoxalase family protein
VRLDGIHHITAITSDAQRNLDFYAGVLGLRFVKKTVNFDAPDHYHLYYGDHAGNPGTILTFFEYPGIGAGRAGAGMIHRIQWRVPSAESLDYWARRLDDAGCGVHRESQSLRSSDPEGLDFELVIDDAAERDGRSFGGVPLEHALMGFVGARAFARHPTRGEGFLAAWLDFSVAGDGLELRGPNRTCWFGYDVADGFGVQGAGTVHHIAWTCEGVEQPQWRERVGATGLEVTDVLDRTYFRSIYFREPNGVLFEIATRGPGFAVDEDPDRLGEELSLPAQHEHLRARLEAELSPLEPPRQRAS